MTLISLRWLIFFVHLFRSHVMKLCVAKTARVIGFECSILNESMNMFCQSKIITWSSIHFNWNRNELFRVDGPFIWFQYVRAAEEPGGGRRVRDNRQRGHQSNHRLRIQKEIRGKSLIEEKGRNFVNGRHENISNRFENYPAISFSCELENTILLHMPSVFNQAPLHRWLSFSLNEIITWNVAPVF